MNLEAAGLNLGTEFCFIFKEKRGWEGRVGNLFYSCYLFMSVLGSEVKLFKQSDVDLSACLTVAQILLTLLIIILITIAPKASCLGC